MSELALQLIRQAKAEGWTTLDLGRTGLTELPDELFALEKMETLILKDTYWDFEKKIILESQNKGKENNTIKSFSDKTVKLEQVTRLHISLGRPQPIVYVTATPSNLDYQIEKDNDSSNFIDIFWIFHTFPNLLYLDIESPEISEIYLLKLFPFLQSLNIEGFLYFSQSISNLHFLFLEDKNDIYHLPENIIAFPSLQELRLKGRYLETLRLSSKNKNLHFLEINILILNQIEFSGSFLGLRQFNLVTKKIDNLFFLEKFPSLNSLELQIRISSPDPHQSTFNADGRILIPSLKRNLKGLENMKSLENLIIAEDQVVDMNFLRELKHLKFLDIRKSEITNTSALINLDSLKSLRLINCNIEGVTFLKKMTNLVFLDLRKNKIKDISSLKDLSNIEYLYLHDNQLKDISCLSALVKLKHLDLRGNEINNIQFLDKLIHLTTLYLSSNNIKDISILAKLKQLNIIDLRDNQILDITPIRPLIEQRLIVKIKKDNRKEGIYLLHNPLEIPPMEVVMEGNAAILNYFRSLEGETSYLHQAKLILLGNGMVGKSSIRTKLIDKKAPLPKKEDRTQVLDIQSYEIKALEPSITELETPIDFRLDIWDFGGQGKYREVQQLFCSRKTIYLFVTSADDQPGKDDYIGFEYWIAMANAFTFSKNRDSYSPVIHVYNKVDLGIVPIDEAQRVEIFPNIYPDFVKISCKTLQNFEHLEDAIRKVLPQVNHDIFKNKFSKKWLAVKEQLEAMRAQNYINYETFSQIAQQEGLNPDEANTWIRVLDRIGTVIYFGDNAELKDWIILNPLWVKDALYKVLDFELIRNGELQPEYIKLVWNEFPQTTHQKLLALMLAFEFCYEQQDNFGKPFYIVPSLLNEAKPHMPEYLEKFDYHLRFDYQPFIPAGTVNKLIVRLQAAIYQNLKWKNGLILHDVLTNAFAEVTEAWYEKTVYLRLKGEDVSGLYKKIRDTLFELNQKMKETKFIQRLDFGVKVKDGDKWVDIEMVERYNVKKFEPLFKSIKKSNSVIKAFISYSKADKDGLEKLKKHLSPLVDYKKQMLTWDDSKLIPGDEWDPVIHEELETADIIILLISADFLNTPYIREQELNIAIERYKRKKAKIIPIVWRACGWADAFLEKFDMSIGDLTALPIKGHPISSWKSNDRWANEDDAWTEVYNNIKKVLAQL